MILTALNISSETKSANRRILKCREITRLLGDYKIVPNLSPEGPGRKDWDLFLYESESISRQ